MEIASGKKTYITGAAMIASGAGLILKSFAEGTGFDTEGLQLVLSGFAFIFLRKGVESKK